MILLDLLDDLYLDRLYKLRDAEHQVAGVLLKFAERADSDELGKCFETHFGTTQNHIDRLEALLGRFPEPLTPRASKGMRGILAEAKALLKARLDPELADEVLTATAQTVAHYEIAGYGISLTFARALRLDNDATLLRKSLIEERSMERELARFAQASVPDLVDPREPVMGREPIDA